MSDEVLNQADIDSLLKIIGDDVPDDVPGDTWRPGELEAMEKLGLLIGEALAIRWRELGGSLEISPPVVDQCEAGAEASLTAGPALWVVGGLSGKAGGKLAVRLGDPLVTDPAGADDLAAALAPGMAALGEAMGELVGGPVGIELSGHRWLGAGEQASAGDVLATGGPVVRFQFSCRLEGKPGVIEVLWGLNEARALLAALPEEGARSRRPEPEAPKVVEEEGVGGADFAELRSAPEVSGSRNIDLILDVPLMLTVELGRTERQIRDVLNLAPGSVLELERLAGEAVDVLVNGKLIARGEVVVVDDKFGVRVIDIVSRADRVKNLR